MHLKRYLPEDSAVHLIDESQQSFSTDETDLRDDSREFVSIMPERDVVRILLDARRESDSEYGVLTEFAQYKHWAFKIAMLAVRFNSDIHAKSAPPYFASVNIIRKTARMKPLFAAGPPIKIFFHIYDYGVSAGISGTGSGDGSGVGSGAGSSAGGVSSSGSGAGVGVGVGSGCGSGSTELGGVAPKSASGSSAGGSSAGGVSSGSSVGGGVSSGSPAGGSSSA